MSTDYVQKSTCPKCSQPSLYSGKSHFLGVEHDAEACNNCGYFKLEGMGMVSFVTAVIDWHINPQPDPTVDVEKEPPSEITPSPVETKIVLVTLKLKVHNTKDINDLSHVEELIENPKGDIVEMEVIDIHTELNNAGNNETTH